MENNQYPKSVRVKLRKDFNKVFAWNKKYYGSQFTVLIHRRVHPHGPSGVLIKPRRKKLVFESEHVEKDMPRLGIVVSKKYSKHAVKRNRFKRLCREAFRLLCKHIAPGFDIVVIANTKGALIAKDNRTIKRSGVPSVNNESIRNFSVDTDISFSIVYAGLRRALERHGIINNFNGD